MALIARRTRREEREARRRLRRIEEQARREEQAQLRREDAISRSRTSPLAYRDHLFTCVATAYGFATMLNEEPEELELEELELEESVVPRS